MTHTNRSIGTVLIASAIVVAAMIPTAFGQTSASTMLELRPHCILPDMTKCPMFEVLDAQHVRTQKLRGGDILDLDIVLVTLKPKDISTVRSWLKYDPLVLEARSVEIMRDALKQPIADEENIDADLGLIKIGGKADGTLTQKETRVARVTFRVKSDGTSTEISFQNFQANASGETAVTHDSSTGKTQLLSARPSTLTVQLGSVQAVQQTATQSSAAPVSTGLSVFSLLQVQNLKVTTRGNSVFVGWQPLTSAELAGYNVYYGSVSGKYIQRRSLTKNETSVILRDLEPGTEYFVALRAFNQQNLESAFSHEVSVTAGKPDSSTSPLAGSVTATGGTGNAVAVYQGNQISGETGMSTQLLGLLLLSAIIGTAFAWHRQFVGVSDRPASHS